MRNQIFTWSGCIIASICACTACARLMAQHRWKNGVPFLPMVVHSFKMGWWIAVTKITNWNRLVHELSDINGFACLQGAFRAATSAAGITEAAGKNAKSVCVRAVGMYVAPNRIFPSLMQVCGCCFVSTAVQGSWTFGTEKNTIKRLRRFWTCRTILYRPIGTDWLANALNVSNILFGGLCDGVDVQGTYQYRGK